MSEEIAWSTAQVRRGLLLAHPSLRAAAAAIGVSARTLQRWLSSTNAPTPQHAARLRAAMLPAPDVLRRQEDEVGLARHAAVRMGVTVSRLPATWRQRRWHEPHTLRLVTHAGLGVSRPVITRSGLRPELGKGWVVDDSRELPHHPAAVIVRSLLLADMAARRVNVRKELLAKGGSTCWLSAKTPPLASYDWDA